LSHCEQRPLTAASPPDVVLCLAQRPVGQVWRSVRGDYCGSNSADHPPSARNGWIVAGSAVQLDALVGAGVSLRAATG